jgi:hypothetical protein
MKFFKLYFTLVLSIFIASFSSEISAQKLNKKVSDKLGNLKELSASERYEVMQKLKQAISKADLDDPLHEIRKETIITGNEIRVLLTNWGSISTPAADNSNADLVWPKGPSGLGYAYEFGPLVAAEVPHAFIQDSLIHIVDDGFLSPSDGDFEPGTAVKWGWRPRVGFSDPNSVEMSHFSDLDKDLDGKPDSWPDNWYNETLGRHVWPAFLGDDATAPDEEVFYVMDDYSNAELPYYPFPNDSLKRGLGLELQVRIFQFNNPLAEDLIFLVYTITNTSPKTLDKVYLGMFGDPHIGGPNDFADDNGSFISAFNESFPFNTRNMLYAFDEDGLGDGGKSPGYFGYRFLESPGLSEDGFDNDNDELTDESPFNDAGQFIFSGIGIYGEPILHWSGDEDGDWDPEFDDVGVDGIEGTGDFGEGDGKPNQLFYEDLDNNGLLDPGELTSESRLEGMRFLGGEPNFGFLDIAESDQLGLTSFNATLFGGNNRPKNDALMWRLITTSNQRPDDPPPEIEQQADNVFIYGSGPFKLRPGESQRFSIALLLGNGLDDLLQNAETSQQVFESDYRFAKPPIKPRLVAVPGDKKVTLYWDTGAEKSFDPFIARANPDDAEKGFDFEGYRIYRSKDFSFNDTKQITDSKGIDFLSVPWKQINGVPAQFDLINDYSGLSGIEYKGRGVRFDLGNNTGLVHSFVDSNKVVNGVTYFYAVTSYDHGDLIAEIPPSESQRSIKRDALTRVFGFDVNTAMVVPGPQAQGYLSPGMNDNEFNLLERISGNATGVVNVKFLDPFKVQNDKTYDVVFEDVQIDDQTSVPGYSVIDQQTQTNSFVARDTVFVNLPVRNFVESSVSVTNQSGGSIDPNNYELDYLEGRIRGKTSGVLPNGEQFNISYKFKPVAASLSINNEDNNEVFDGMRIFVQNENTALDPDRSGFKVKNSQTNFEVAMLGSANVGNPKPYPTDFEIQFVDYDTLSDGQLSSAPDTSIITKVASPFKIIDVQTGDQVDFFINESVPKLRNRRWDWSESIVIIRPGASRITDTVYEIKFAPPSDTIKTADGTQDSLIIFDDPVYPGNGDVFLIFSKKPFEAGDSYSFTTYGVQFDTELAEDALADVHVVPNPYIAYSSSEIAAPRSGERDDRRLEFRSLPQKCTIRIYSITGELVDTIEKDDFTDYAVWNMLTFESQQTAYGVYIYHVDAPGVGTKIGRFALIK